MLQLRDIMTSDVISVAPETPLAEVAELFATEGISGVPVTSAGRVVGVISASDLVDFSASGRGEDGRGGVWAAYENDVDAAAGHAGFFTDGWPGPRPTPQAVDRDEDEASGPDAWGEFTASDVMTRSLFALSPGTAVDAAGRFMLQRGIHRVLVIDGGSLRGIVTSMDFVRVVAQDLRAARVG